MYYYTYYSYEEFGPGALSKYQKARGIDTSNRIRIS
jgi:hypothetical protein